MAVEPAGVDDDEAFLVGFLVYLTTAQNDPPRASPSSDVPLALPFPTHRILSHRKQSGRCRRHRPRTPGTGGSADWDVPVRWWSSLSMGGLSVD